MTCPPLSQSVLGATACALGLFGTASAQTTVPPAAKPVGTAGFPAAPTAPATPSVDPASASSLPMTHAATDTPADPTVLMATLDGKSEVPGPANPNGSGLLKSRLFIKDGKFCYTLTSAGLTKLTMAHIHAGAAGVSGDPVITLLPDEPTETCLKIDGALALKIAQDPARYYVNIHTTAFPKGAIRGQLAKTAS
jgi:hypothetical protein